MNADLTEENKRPVLVFREKIIANKTLEQINSENVTICRKNH